MSDLSDEIIERLTDCRDKLRAGERIMVTTLEQCGCATGVVHDSLSRHQAACHLCNGTGWIRGARTLLGEKKP